MNSTILISGASGFTGKHACKFFLDAGYQVIGLVRKPPSSAETNVTNYVCDVTDQSEISKLIEKVKPDYILHLAGRNSVGDSWLDPVGTIETNVLSTMYIVEAVRRESLASNILVVGSALQTDLQDLRTLEHPYSLSKSMQALIAQAWEQLYDMNVMIAKPSNLIGPGLSNGVCSILAKQVVEIEKGERDPVLTIDNLYAMRDFLDVRDAVSAYEMILKLGAPGDVFDVNSGNSRSLKDVTDLLVRLSNKSIRIEGKKSERETREEKKPLKLMQLGWKQEIPWESSIEDILQFHRESI